MTTKSIAARLARASFPAGESPPNPDQFATWPEQARLLCTGELVQLRSLQLELAKRFGAPVEISPEARAQHPAEQDRAGLLWMLLITLLLLASVAAYVAASRSKACICPPEPSVTPPPPPRPVTTLSMSTDLLFDFNRAKPYSQVHEQEMLEALSVLFKQFDGITVESIQAHTDPIGNTKDNRELGYARALFIHDLVARAIADPELKARFKSGKLELPLKSDGPSPGDRAIWEACFESFYRKVADKPLSELRRDSNLDDRPSCSQAFPVTSEKDPYPACSRLSKTPPRGMSAMNYAKSAENFRELSTCLAPMRHVLITISHERREYAERINVRPSAEEVVK